MKRKQKTAFDIAVDIKNIGQKLIIYGFAFMIGSAIAIAINPVHSKHEFCPEEENIVRISVAVLRTGGWLWISSLVAAFIIKIREEIKDHGL